MVEIIEFEQEPKPLGIPGIPEPVAAPAQPAAEPVKVRRHRKRELDTGYIEGLMELRDQLEVLQNLNRWQFYAYFALAAMVCLVLYLQIRS